jgi:hypothetical protein
MYLWKAGDKSAAICAACKKKVTTTFEYRTVELESPRAAVPDVLVAACDECGAVAGIPYQSTPKIAGVRGQAMVSFEARVPRELMDAIGLIAAKFHSRLETLMSPLFRFYLREVGRDSSLARMVNELSHDRLAAPLNCRSRISVAVPSPVWDAAWGGARAAGIRKKSELARGLILAAALDARIHEIPELADRRKGKSTKARQHAFEALAESL